MDWFLYDNGLRHERIKAHIWLTNASLRWNGAVWWTEAVHLGEPVYIWIIQFSFIEEFTILLSQVEERSDYRYGVEVTQFLLYNQPLI